MLRRVRYERALSLLALIAATGGVWSVYVRRPDAIVSKTEYMMDTAVEIKIAQKDSPDVQKAFADAFREMRRVERLLSNYDSSSDISKINRNAGVRAVRVSRETVKVLATAQKYYRLSRGAFDITVGPLVKLWGIGTDRQRVPAGKDIENLLPAVNSRYIEVDLKTCRVALLRKGMSIDLGAIAKGYAVDAAADVLKESHIRSALINAGSSSIRIIGKRRDGRPWRIGIQDPRSRTGGLLGVLELSEGSIGTSADNQRFFIEDGKRYHHILDPRTGYPAKGTRSITVLCKYAVDADALSTAMFVMKPSRAKRLAEELKGVETTSVDALGRIRSSKGFPKLSGAGE